MNTGSRQNPQSGFTLIELLVSTAILVILVTIVAANFSGSQITGQRNVLLSSNNLVSDLHKLQSFSLSSRNVTNNSGQINPAANYSASFTAGATSYTLADTDDKGNAGSISTSNLLPNLKINAIQITTPTSTVNPSQVTVNFSVPYSRISASYSGSSSPNELNDIIRLQIMSSTSSSICEYVYINGITGNINTNTTCP